ncbi:pyruvate formate lyase 1-activating protein [Echinimonas agarilytica]|uniref:Pyruvate formate-lyase-activating enzyme n=1 Tax=Echinimonas agarilytica TaxID=1215918 RepID=A0AA42B879_9GAMM|nr:pyruvate formate lyase 1-activating protein [Echinimonas agarilytica]MCM2680860.1 pyruvate formate lyase 1-activating protein [Echinimonas agarilytica]
MTIKGRVHSVETCGTVDGPGIRYIVFMQGCLMRCKYCHNRDTWDVDAGQEMTVEEIMTELLSYRHFIEASDGGITASGGEATLQAEFVTELFKACQKEGIHTCLDTNGFVRHHSDAIEHLLDVTDLVMLDLKQMDDAKHIDLTKVSNRHAKEFALRLAERNQKTWLRYVVVGGYTDDVASAEELADFILPMKNIERVELLPYHELGKHKWEAMGEPYELTEVHPPSKETMETICDVFKSRGLNVIY